MDSGIAVFCVFGGVESMDSSWIKDSGTRLRLEEGSSCGVTKDSLFVNLFLAYESKAWLYSAVGVVSVVENCWLRFLEVVSTLVCFGVSLLDFGVVNADAAGVCEILESGVCVDKKEWPIPDG